MILTSNRSFDKPCRDARSKIWLARSGVCVAFPCDLRLCREIKMRQSVANGNLLYLKLMLQAFTQKKSGLPFIRGWPYHAYCHNCMIPSFITPLCMTWRWCCWISGVRFTATACLTMVHTKWNIDKLAQMAWFCITMWQVICNSSHAKGLQGSHIVVVPLPRHQFLMGSLFHTVALREHVDPKSWGAAANHLFRMINCGSTDDD